MYVCMYVRTYVRTYVQTTKHMTGWMDGWIVRWIVGGREEFYNQMDNKGQLLLLVNFLGLGVYRRVHIHMCTLN